jgi:hypothetical protein
LLGDVEGEDLALVAFHDVGEHPEQASVLGLGDQGRMVEGVDKLAEARHAGMVALGQEGLDGRSVGGLAGTDLHGTPRG